MTLNQKVPNLTNYTRGERTKSSGLRTVHPGIRKSRISWYQNRPKDFSSSCFLSTMHNCELLPVVQHQTVSS